MVSNTRTFKFGIEIECLLGINNEKFNNRLCRRGQYDLIKELMDHAMRLARSSEKVCVDSGDQQKGSARDSWTLTEDISLIPDNDESKHSPCSPSIVDHHSRGYFSFFLSSRLTYIYTVPVEIVSPVLEHGFAPDASWRHSVNQLFDSLTECDIETNKTCATHFHLSPMSGSWSMNDLRKLGCCILYFEPAMENLYPADYRQNEYAAANGVDNPIFNKQDLGSLIGLQDCFKTIFEKQTEEELKGLFNPPRLPDNDPYDRYYGWNFTNLKQRGGGTVEFRRPPGVTRSDICQNWVNLTVAFVTAATSIKQTGDLFKRYPTRDGNDFRRFLRTALKEAPADGHFGNLLNDLGGNLPVERIQRRLRG